MSEINQANHESWNTIKRCDHGNVTEFDPGSRTRKTDKDQTSHDRQTKEADHDLKCNDAMTVKSVRVGVSKACCGQHFDTEEEGVVKRTRSESRDAGPAEQIERGKAEVDKHVDPENQAAKLWPAPGSR